MSDDRPVVPIAPELAVEAKPAQRLVEKMARDVADFESSAGVPVAYALAMIDADGTTIAYFQTEGFDGAKSPGRGGWRGFLALAALRLQEAALGD